jgi:membrane protein DedA with SNARE-associated domain
MTLFSSFIGTIVRGILFALAGYLANHFQLIPQSVIDWLKSDDTTTNISIMVLVAGGTLWSWWQKWKTHNTIQTLKSSPSTLTPKTP